jgi:hypothetical protein
MSKRKRDNTPRKIEYCEIEPKECDGQCCYAKAKKKKGSR